MVERRRPVPDSFFLWFLTESCKSVQSAGFLSIYFTDVRVGFM